MNNPYEPPSSVDEHEEPQRANRLKHILVFCTVAYALHVLALWGIACFHDAHNNFELREPFSSISTDFGARGLFGVALIYAFVPAFAYFACLMLLGRLIRSDRSWSMLMDIVHCSLGATLAADGVLGLSLFTTG
jgi:hypothetical protein